MELLTRDYFHRSLMSTLIDFITKNSHFCGKLLMHEEKKKLISIWLRVHTHTQGNVITSKAKQNQNKTTQACSTERTRLERSNRLRLPNQIQRRHSAKYKNGIVSCV